MTKYLSDNRMNKMNNFPHAKNIHVNTCNQINDLSVEKANNIDFKDVRDVNYFLKIIIQRSLIERATNYQTINHLLLSL